MSIALRHFLRHKLLSAALSIGLCAGMAAGEEFAAVARSTDAIVPQISDAPTFLGSVSCAASNCHGNPRRETATSSAAHYYWDRDPHQNAGNVLKNTLSLQIAERLKLPKPAAESRECLICHAPAALQSDDQQSCLTRLAEGVSCESCHGPASQWLSPHRSADWKRSDVWTLDRRDKTGFRQTKDLLTRVDLCADCHVGNANQSVNHDLIAAGHPRLTFEYAAYQSLMPAHWRRADDRRRNGDKSGEQSTYETRNWLLGQLLTVDHELDILAAAAALPEAAWPELAQYDCFGCHHDLNSQSWRQQRTAWNLRPGEFQWGTWSLGLLSELPPILPEIGLPSSETLHDIPDVLRSLHPPRDQFLKSIPPLRAALRSAARQVSTAKWTTNQLAQIRSAFLEVSPSLTNQGWDRSTQLYLAVAALEQDLANSHRTGEFLPLDRQEALLNVRRQLAFQTSSAKEANAGRPESPQMLEKNWTELRRAFEKLNADVDRTSPITPE